MAGKRPDAGTHAVLVIDPEFRVVAEIPAVSAADVTRTAVELRQRHGEAVRILVDGAAIDPKALACTPEVAPASVQIVGPPTQAGSVELAHAMLWDTYDRAARVQSWMLEQASAFTLQLLENNRRLADQASELQGRYQRALAEIDVMHREHKLMEAEAASSRLSRHLIEQAKAEAAASAPRCGVGEIVDDVIDGAAAALGVLCGMYGPKGSKDSN